MWTWILAWLVKYSFEQVTDLCFGVMINDRPLLTSYIVNPVIQIYIYIYIYIYTGVPVLVLCSTQTSCWQNNMLHQPQSTNFFSPHHHQSTTSAKFQVAKCYNRKYAKASLTKTLKQMIHLRFIPSELCAIIYSYCVEE